MAWAILRNTPLWVWGVLALLLALGLAQVRNRPCASLQPVDGPLPRIPKWRWVAADNLNSSAIWPGPGTDRWSGSWAGPLRVRCSFRHGSCS